MSRRFLIAILLRIDDMLTSQILKSFLCMLLFCDTLNFYQITSKLLVTSNEAKVLEKCIYTCCSPVLMRKRLMTNYDITTISLFSKQKMHFKSSVCVKRQWYLNKILQMIQMCMTFLTFFQLHSRSSNFSLIQLGKDVL